MTDNITRPTLMLDVQEYQHYLDSENISEEDKIELLETLWEIICEFVQLGFYVHPVQQAKEACGKGRENRALVTQDDLHALESGNKDLIAAFAKTCATETGGISDA